MKRIAHMDNEPKRWSPAPHRLPLVALTILILAALLGGYALIQYAPNHGQAQPLYGLHSWPRPDLALVVTGQMHGYIDPCGCSHPQYGGLVRRYNFIEALKQKGWPVVGLDLGELPQTTGLPRQNLLKLELSMKALDLMGYRAIGVGKHELSLQLTDVLSYYSANHPLPRPLATNLAWAATPREIYYELNARPFEIIADVPDLTEKRRPINPRLGVLSLLGKDFREQFKAEKFLPWDQAMDSALQGFAGADLGVVMYHEFPNPPNNVGNKEKWIEDERHKRVTALVNYCDGQRQKNGRIPPVALVLSLTNEPEPPGQLIGIQGSSAKILEIGHKGRYVGVVGFYRKGTAYEMKYQLVSMDPDFQKPADPRGKNPVLALMEDYARQVEKDKLLAKVPRTPHHTQIDRELVKRGIQARFVGSERCAGCHEHAYKVWEDSHHAHAFKTLVDKAKNPSNRQYDPECVVCHTVGFRHPTGYFDPPQGGDLEKHNVKLQNVGCESCHGPGSAHSDNPDDVTQYPLINPFRGSDAERKAERNAQQAADANGRQAAQKHKEDLFRHRMSKLDDFCQKCHDTDNAVNWSKVDFLQKWVGGRIIHTTPRPGVPALINPALEGSPRKDGPAVTNESKK
jgi:hypothetical protein